jgi:hypothetical protein
MGGEAAVSADEELVSPFRGDESGEFPIPPESDHTQRALIAQRDRLLRRTLEEELLSVAAQPGGQDLLDLLRYESDPHRFCKRLDRFFRLNIVQERFTLLERAIGLDAAHRIPVNEHSLSREIGQLRYDWLRGKVQRRAEERRHREMTGTLDVDDMLWRSVVRSHNKK